MENEQTSKPATGQKPPTPTEAETVMLALSGDLAGIAVDEYQETCPNPCTCEAEIEVVA